MKRQFRHTRRGYPPTCCWGGIHLFDIPPFKEISNSTTAFYRIHPRLKKPWYSAEADKNRGSKPHVKPEWQFFLFRFPGRFQQFLDRREHNDKILVMLPEVRLK